MEPEFSGLAVQMSELSVEAPLLVGVDPLLDVFLALGHHEVDQAGEFAGGRLDRDRGVYSGEPCAVLDADEGPAAARGHGHHAQSLPDGVDRLRELAGEVLAAADPGSRREREPGAEVLGGGEGGEVRADLRGTHRDIWGKALGQPIHALLGGAFRDRIHAYATGCYYPEEIDAGSAALDALTAEAEGHIRSGFSTLKMKIGLLSVAADGARVAAVCEVIGPNVTLLVDANHAYKAAGAIRMGRELERWNVGWFEEPVVPEDRTGYRRVREALSVAVAGGECEFTRFGFRDLFEGQCVDIAQPDLCVCGGYSEWLKIQALASSHDVLTIPRVWGSGVALATALHALAVVPPTPHTDNPVPIQNEPVVEYDRQPNPLRDELLVETVALEDGCLAVPHGHGLGIAVNDEALGRYRVAH